MRRQVTRQELRRRLGTDLFLEIASRQLDALGVETSVFLDLGGLLVKNAIDKRSRDRLAVGCLGLVVHPRPQLATRDLSRGGVLHHLATRRGNQSKPSAQEQQPGVGHPQSQRERSPILQPS